MHDEELTALQSQGLLEIRGGTLRTTRRWQAAMARAAFRRLQDTGDDDYDLRATIALALFELAGTEQSDERIAALVEAVLPIEVMELDPRPHIEAR